MFAKRPAVLNDRFSAVKVLRTYLCRRVTLQPGESKKELILIEGPILPQIHEFHCGVLNSMNSTSPFQTAFPDKPLGIQVGQRPFEFINFTLCAVNFQTGEVNNF